MPKIIGSPIKNGQGHVREGSGVGFRVRLCVRVSLQGLYGRVGFEGLSMFELWSCPFFIGDPDYPSPEEVRQGQKVSNNPPLTSILILRPRI